MHVVVASHHRLPVSGYGGSQRVVVALVRGLAALGHRVTLLAQQGSKVPEAGRVVELPGRILSNPDVDLRPHVPGDADVLHAHFPLKRAPGTLPFCQTLHANWKPGTPVPPNTVFLSRDHAKRHGSSAFVYNGLDPADYIFRRVKEQWDLFLGRLHAAKGYHWAVDAAKRTGRRLIVAGGWRPSFTGSVKYVGEVDGKRKAVLLARARALWMPVLWDEPFGLTAIESLFSGTPILGTHRGALPELVSADVGALADTPDELLARARTIHERAPAACRARAERFFTHRLMAEEYVRVYQRVMAGEPPPAGRPTPDAPPA